MRAIALDGWLRRGRRDFICRGLLDEVGDRVGLGHVDGVATAGVDDSRTSTLGNRPLGRRWDHPVLGGDQVPKVLSSPHPTTTRELAGDHGRMVGRSPAEPTRASPP